MLSQISNSILKKEEYAIWAYGDGALLERGYIDNDFWEGNSDGNSKKRNFKQEWMEHPLKNMVDRGIFDSGCSGHMTGNKEQLEDFEEFNGGSVTFGAASTDVGRCVTRSVNAESPHDTAINNNSETVRASQRAHNRCSRSALRGNCRPYTNDVISSVKAERRKPKLAVSSSTFKYGMFLNTTEQMSHDMAILHYYLAAVTIIATVKLHKLAQTL
ncbi:hypothetical protein Tco_0134690 [Tanacetum coccineum]